MFLIFIFLITMPVIVNADWANTDSINENYAYCVYEYKPGAGCRIKLKVTYKSSTSSITYAKETSSTYSSVSESASAKCEYSYDFFSGKDFKDSSGKLVCPKVNINNKMDNSKVPVTFTVTIAPDKNGTYTPTSESKVNNSAKDTNNESAQKTIVCNYNTSDCGGYTVRVISNQVYITLKTTGYQVMNNLKASYFANGTCPKVYVLKNNNTCYFDNKLINQNYESSTGEAINPETGEKPAPPSSSSGSSNLEKLNGCSSLLEDPNTPGTPAYYLSFAFSIMRYAAIILLIVMTIMDFTGSVAAQDNDVMKKAMGKLSKRAIMLVIIFFLPTVIDLMLKFIHNAQISGCIDLSK